MVKIFLLFWILQPLDPAFIDSLLHKYTLSKHYFSRFLTKVKYSLTMHLFKTVKVNKLIAKSSWEMLNSA